jgi:ubiquinone/menaquinone biosynthesis C-methylase UbiE
MDINQLAYSSKEVVSKYTTHEALQKGEVSIFEKFKVKIKNGRVLDIGIGGGRTTAHLIPMSKEYVGVDFSTPFVEHCQAKFASLPNVTIQYGDARHLDSFSDHDFDFILFSYNGIDCVDFEGRKKILSECSRLVKQDGVLSFSFHNKGNLDKLYSFQYPRNPFKYPWEWRRMNKVSEINGSKEKYRSMDWFIIKDGCEDFTTDILYIDPLYQRTCLELMGFKTFYFHDALTGRELTADETKKSETPWIYITALK